ncbi:CheR family methyltransferase [Propionivibrio soli]|uniref:CheR family methyltransferase n=1 Tax=Propionivibrio soli TaxID=2976531 RepID=UPI0021E9732E|nr:protein-glutamate O-methyltransferase CheR [Propionivibrio soli]
MPASQAEPVAEACPLTDTEYAQFRKLIFDIAGISLTDAKKALVVGRLVKRLRHFGFTSFGEYFRYITSGSDPAERQMMVDLLTTNETYFFREPKHFDFVREIAAQHRRGAFRVWSAASSSGEEAYSVAMVLADTLGDAAWEVVGTDISTRVLERASRGLYPLERTGGIPPQYLKTYCLKGVGEYAGTLLITRELREHVQFRHSNLLSPRTDIGCFDIIFLRNVMIYFDAPTKRKVVANLLPFLKSTGYLIIGHSESLNGVTTDLALARPTIFQRIGTR